MPKRATTAIAYREGIDPDINSQSAGLSSMEDVVMSRGVIITDANDELYKWMSAIHNPSTGLVGREALSARPANTGANKYRKDVTIQMLDREGNVARQWTLYNAWPSNFVPGSDLNAGEDGDKSLEQLTLKYEDFREENPGAATARASSPEYA
jgi:phage tail-like protein